MKKLISMVALAAICFGTASVYAATPVTMTQDTMKKTKMKMKKKKPMKMKMKMKKDSTAKM